MHADEVGPHRKLLEADRFGAALPYLLVAEKRVVRDRLEPEPACFRAEVPADLSVPDDAEHGSRDAMDGRSAAERPISLAHGSFVGRKASRVGEQEGQHVLRDLVQAVGGHVGHGNRPPCRLLDSDVVDADAVAADHLQTLPGGDHPVGDPREAGENRVCLRREADELVLVARLGNEEARPDRGQHLGLRIDRGPGVVGHEHDPLARVEVDPAHAALATS